MLGGFYHNGGIGRVSSIVANSLAEDENFKVHTLSYVKKDLPYLYKLNPKIIDDHFLTKPENMWLVLMTGGVKRLKRYIRENEIDIIIACGALYFPICALACKNERCKCICWEHSNGNNVADHRFQMFSRRIGCRYADAILNITKQDQEIYKRRFGNHKYYQIYNPLDQSLESSRDEYNRNAKKIMTVGRLCYQKNYPALIKVAKEVLDAYKDWEWNIYGEGPDRKEIEEMILEAGLENRLVLKGQVSDLYSQYSDYAFLVMTSRYEGFGMALIEAAGRRLPIIAFDVECGPREIIKDGINGYLIPAFDCSLMANRIKNMCENPQLRVDLSESTKDTIKGFSPEFVVEEWVKMLSSVYEFND